MLKKIIDYIKDKRDIIYIIPLIILSLFLIGKCSSNNSLKDEVFRLENNIIALNDTLNTYIDDYGRVVGEKHSYILKQEELDDSIKKLVSKNRELISYINTNVGIKDTVLLPTYIERTVYEERDIKEKGVIKFDRLNVYDKSSDELHVSIPYTYTDSLITQPATVSLNQSIYLTSMIERDKKTGQTYIKLITDYPATFNQGEGILITNSSSFTKSIQKTKGIGLSIGPQLGVSYDMVNRRITPTIGVGITIGFNYTPRFLQW